MAESLRSTYDLIKSAFPIRVGVLTSQDAEIISQRNNLSFAELIHPFCTLTSEAQMHGIGSQAYRVYNMHAHVSDIRRHSVSTEDIRTRQHIADLVLRSGENETPQMVTVSCGDQNLSVNRSCPWMETYRDLILRYGPPQEHEFLNCFVACMLVVSSLHPAPMQEFGNLSQLQNRIQHGDGGACRWMTPNTLKYFVLLHDVQQGDAGKAKEVFSVLQSTYGSKVCYMLQINSRSVPIATGEAMPSPWHQFMNYSAVFLGDEREEVLQSKASDSGEIQDQQNLHRLCGSNTSAMDHEFGRHLTMVDHNSLQCFVQDFTTIALLPYLEKSIKNINEQLSAKKGLHKSLFRATRTLFGSNKVSGLSGAPLYNRDASELLLRKVADLCFLAHMYEQAFHLYHAAKKEYTNDQAWLYAAAASEMAAVSNFMQRTTQKNYPSHYMEACINSYVDVCKNDYLALRCTLVHAECLQFLGLHQDAAYYLVKATSEKDDLRSALLLEQAAHCYLKMKVPKPKKFAFQLVLSGHRFSKCGQRVHALRCYNMALQVYLGQEWKLAEDHINLAIARQSSNMKRIDYACKFFRKLLVQESLQSELQQATILREFVHIFQQSRGTKSGVNYARLGLPQLLDCETVVCVEQLKQEVVEPDTVLKNNARITALEDMLLDAESASHNDIVGAVNCFCKYTINDESPQLAVGETATIEVTLKNYLSTPVCLFEITLCWDLKPLKSTPDEKNGPSESNELVHCDSYNQLWIPESGEKKALFIVKPLKPGQLTATGVFYSVGQSSTTEQKMHKKLESCYTVLDYQPFNITGKRLNRTKEDKMSLVYNTDCRLSLQVFPMLPKFDVEFEGFPTAMVCNEVIMTNLVVNNTGSVQLDILKVISCDRIQITLIDSSSREYFLPNAPTYFNQDNLRSDCLPNLLVKPLLPDEIAKFTVCLKAPNSPGNCSAGVLFYCKSLNLPAPSGRAHFIQNCVMCAEGVNVQADMVTALTRNNFVVSVVAKNVLCSESDPLLLKNVACVSSDCSIWPIHEKGFPSLMKNTHLFMYLLLEKTVENTLSEESSSKVAVKHVHSCDSPLIALNWTCRNGSETKHIQGHHQLNIKNMFCNLGTFSEVYDDLGTVDNKTLSMHTLHNMLSWRLVYEPERHHDFVAEHLCHVEVILRLFNMSNVELLVHIGGLRLGNRSKSISQTEFAWIGASERKLVVAAHGETKIPLKACFVKHGIYKLSGIGVTAVPNRMKHNEQAIPQKPLCRYFINIRGGMESGK